MRFAIPESATWPHIFRWNVFKQFTYVPFKKKAEPSWSSFFQQLNLTARAGAGPCPLRMRSGVAPAGLLDQAEQVGLGDDAERLAVFHDDDAADAVVHHLPCDL